MLQKKNGAPKPGLLWVSTVVLLLTLSGCGDPKGQINSRIAEANQTNIQKITSCYLLFQAFNNGGPKDEESFRGFFVGNNSMKKHLDRIGLDQENFDRYLIGKNDEPLTIIWGVGEPSNATGGKPVVFEKTSDGCTVGFTDAEVKEVDEAEYERLLASMKKKK